LNTREGLATRLKIVDTLSAMVDEMGLEKITIGNLCKRAGISRQTFYYHFQNVKEVFSWAITYQVVSKLQSIPHLPTPADHTVAVADAFRKYSVLTYTFANGKDSDEFWGSVQKALITTNYNFLKAGISDIPEIEVKTLAIFHADGYLGILRKWIDREMTDDINLVMDRLVTAIYKALNSPIYENNVKSRYIRANL